MGKALAERHMQAGFRPGTQRELGSLAVRTRHNRPGTFESCKFVGRHQIVVNLVRRQFQFPNYCLGVADDWQMGKPFFDERLLFVFFDERPIRA